LGLVHAVLASVALVGLRATVIARRSNRHVLKSLRNYVQAHAPPESATSF
jgi:hypothetical protein